MPAFATFNLFAVAEPFSKLVSQYGGEEHAYMVDYVPAEKKTYVEAFLANVNWTVVEARIKS